MMRESGEKAAPGGEMKVTIHYICPVCKEPGQVTVKLTENLAPVKQDFSCTKCGFENSIQMGRLEEEAK